MATDVIPTQLLDVHDLPLEALAALPTTDEILARIPEIHLDTRAGKATFQSAI